DVGSVQIAGVLDEPGLGQGREQGAGVLGPYAPADGQTQQRRLRAGAVEQVEDLGASRVGQLKDHGPARVGTQLEPVRITPEPSDRGEQYGTAGVLTAHGPSCCPRESQGVARCPQASAQRLLPGAQRSATRRPVHKARQGGSLKRPAVAATRPRPYRESGSRWCRTRGTCPWPCSCRSC